MNSVLAGKMRRFKMLVLGRSLEELLGKAREVEMKLS